MTTQPMPLVQVFAPDGTLGDIPYDKLHDALAAGAKPAAKFKAPDGTVGYVPADKAADALKAGGQRVPLDLNDADGGKPGFWTRAQKFLENPSCQTMQEMQQSNQAAGKFGADTLAGQMVAGPAAQVFNKSVLPGLKAVPFAGKAISAIEQAPSAVGKVVTGAATGGGTGALEAAIRGKSAAEIAKEAGTGALIGGGLGLAVPIAERLAPPEAVYPGADLPAAEESYAARGAEAEKVRRMNEILDRRNAVAARQAAANAPVKLSDLVTTPSEGRPATWTNQSVSDLASSGNPLTRPAAVQAQLRQLSVPNVGLIADPNATMTPSVGGAKSVTHFDTAGNPIGQASEPQYLYRIRPVGEKGIPAAAANSPAQLTSSIDQAQSWMDAKNATGPHEVIRVDANSLKPGQTTAREFSPGIDWHKVHEAIPESQVEVVVPHQAAIESE
jgi:hypothetical protein